MMLIEGKVMGLVILVLSFVLFYLFMYLARTGYKVSARTFPAIAALTEAVGRAAEMRKPIYYTTGEFVLTDPNAAQALAGISILGYVTQLCAEIGVKIAFFSWQGSDSLPLVEENMRNAYMAEGKPEDFDPNMIHFQPRQGSFVAASLGFMQREMPASCIMLGLFGYESVILGEGGNAIGAIQIGGSDRTPQLPFLVATCDYTLMSEELYAAGALIEGDPDVLGILRGEDIIKLIIVFLMIIGFFLGSIGITILVDLFRL